MKVLPTIAGERAWSAADRAAEVPTPGTVTPGHYDAIARADLDTWAGIDSAAYWEALECLPPIYVPGGFMVSEPVCDSIDGDPMYLCIVGQEDAARAGYRTKRQMRGTA